MVTTPGIIRSAVSGLSAVSPRAGARAALAAFFETRPRRAIRDDELPTQDRAIRGDIAIHGERVATYRWGAGDETVLLVHGWRGRASQFAPIVRELVRSGCHVVAFDAPAHGDSTGRRTDIRDWVAAIELLQPTHGGFRTIVGHSFGTLAALTAVRHGVTCQSVASIAGAGSPTAFLHEFSEAMDLSGETRRRMSEVFHARLGEDEASMARRYDATTDPSPAGIQLLVLHDDGDRRLPSVWSHRLADAYGDRARLVRTTGFGHTRILGARTTLDTVVALAEGGLVAVDRLLRAEAVPTPPSRRARGLP